MRFICALLFLTACTLRERAPATVAGMSREAAVYAAGQRGYVRFSPVVFSSDGLHALVYYEYRCGGLCGGGDAVWLTRRSGDGWEVRKVVGLWVS